MPNQLGLNGAQSAIPTKSESKTVAIKAERWQWESQNEHHTRNGWSGIRGRTNSQRIENRGDDQPVTRTAL